MARYDLEIDELVKYRPDVLEPAEFDAFWARTLRENPFDAAAVTVERVAGPIRTLDVYDLQFPGFAGEPIRAWYIRPKTEERLPVVVQFQGYGGSRGMPVEHLEWASAGYAHLFMDSRGQGGNWGTGGATPDPHGVGSSNPGYMTRGIERPDDYYYRRIYVDAHHAIEAAATLPGVDPNRIISHGGSQGGGLSIAAASLNPRVFAAMPDVPFLSHFERAVGLTDSYPYAEIVAYLSVFRDRKAMVFDTLSYFDAVNLAKRATCPALFSTALLDDTCPPSTVFAAKNWWAAKSGGDPVRVDIEVYDYNKHEGGQWYQWNRQLEWLASIGV